MRKFIGKRFYLALSGAGTVTVNGYRVPFTDNANGPKLHKMVF